MDSYCKGDHLIKDNRRCLVHIEDEVLVVVRTVARLSDAGVARLFTDLNLDDWVDVKASELLAFNDCNRNLTCIRTTCQYYTYQAYCHFADTFCDTVP